MACADSSEQSVPQQSLSVSEGAATTRAKDPAGWHLGSAGGELECLVCRESYSCARPPKLLGCQHVFCAVCLKLLLCVQDDTWSLTCPLCRKVTSIPGGLICSLRDPEGMRGQLAHRCLEVQLCPQGLADPATSAAGHPNLEGEDGQDAMSANRTAARRLAAHLLFLVLLIILILPFVYPGVIRNSSQGLECGPCCRTNRTRTLLLPPGPISFCWYQCLELGFSHLGQLVHMLGWCPFFSLGSWSPYFLILGVPKATHFVSIPVLPRVPTAWGFPGVRLGFEEESVC
ncbi:E3 ubiquitin-protein ligase RNF186 isoform X1 [Echinops telfairi]|uniref:E3 ubiquitin-protein ligase RNF186 isoform X1 n=1 Tax=Echinops telfairi TaxID=9371 RepID=A0AC55DTM7_ECHTE|nr:E3 ubiquitin-protein ligase RNF186 isoform X1 [Echinops telfairi]